jgi:hypothetical protein
LIMDCFDNINNEFLNNKKIKNKKYLMNMSFYFLLITDSDLNFIQFLYCFIVEDRKIILL